VYESIYLLFNASVMPVWAVMIFAPHSRFADRLTATPIVPLVYAVVYVTLFAISLPGGGEGSMGSMEGLRIAFERDAMLLMAWVHYLCFDMAVGMWELRDARKNGISGFLLAPCLFFTLMLGPSGLMMYVGVRYAKTGHLRWHDEIVLE